MTNIMESLNTGIDVPVERIIWWKPFPIPNNTLENLTPQLVP